MRSVSLQVCHPGPVGVAVMPLLHVRVIAGSAPSGDTDHPKVFRDFTLSF